MNTTLLGTMLLSTAAENTGAIDVTGVTTPIIGLINSFAGPLIGIVAALGIIYCILLGVKLAKAEEPQDREKAKGALKNAIIGFILIFVLIVVLVRFVPVMTEWVSNNSGEHKVTLTGTGFDKK